MRSVAREIASRSEQQGAGGDLLVSDAKTSFAESRIAYKQKGRLVTLGVCAMQKKTKSAPMRQILDRLSAYGEFEIVVFPEDVILRVSFLCVSVCVSE
jgi:hypothetical protein